VDQNQVKEEPKLDRLETSKLTPEMLKTGKRVKENSRCRGGVMAEQGAAKMRGGVGTKIQSDIRRDEMSTIPRGEGVVARTERAVRGVTKVRGGMTATRGGILRGGREREQQGTREIAAKPAMGEIIMGGDENDQRLLLV